MINRREFAFFLALQPASQSGPLPKDKPEGGAGKPYLKFIPIVRDEAELEQRCAVLARGAKLDPLLIAYVVETPAWNQTWVQDVRGLPEEHGLKQLYVQFLKETYGYQIQRLTAAYGVEASSFTELGTMRWKSLDLERTDVTRDDAVFLGWIAETLFGAVVSGIRREDKSHAIVSPYVDEDVPEPVRQAAWKHFETVWIGSGVQAPGGKQAVRWRPD